MLGEELLCKTEKIEANSTAEIKLGVGLLYVEEYESQYGAFYFINFWGQVSLLASGTEAGVFSVTKTSPSQYVTIQNNRQNPLSLVFIGKIYN